MDHDQAEHLNTAHSATLTGILARCPALRAVRRHVAEFAVMMGELGGERLDGWMHAVEANARHGPAYLSPAGELDIKLRRNLTLYQTRGLAHGGFGRSPCTHRRLPRG